MAEEEVVATACGAVASPAPSDHKRKLEEMEPDSKVDSVKKAEDKEEDGITNGGGDVADVDADADGTDAKRPRLEENEPDAFAVSENGSQEGTVDEHKEGTEQPLAVETNSRSEGNEETEREAVEKESAKPPPTTGGQKTDEIPISSNENEKLPIEDVEEQETFKGEVQERSSEVPSQKDDSFVEEQPSSGTTMSRKIEVPNNKVGVLIGKAGDTIRFLQINSGARIQIMRDDEADLSAATRPVELIGNAESINKAEKLIKDVIAEADAGGSPSLVARGISTVQAAGVGEQILIQVPNEKVGLIIGKGGETIKNLQTRSGARIQLIPQHPPEGDQSKERTVRVTGDKKQIEMAREMIKDVMNQSVRPSTLSGGYNQQTFRPRGPAAAQWGPRGPHCPPTGYDYQQRGQYPSQNQQYPASAYSNYPRHQPPPRGNFGPGWDTRPSPTMHGPSPQVGGYNYYGRQGGRGADAPTSAMLSNPIHSHGPGPSPVAAMGAPSSQANYNYGQAHPDYGQPAPYAHQTAPLAQNYGHGYNEVKYENQAPMQHAYAVQGGSQTSMYPQGGMVPGYGPQDQYGKLPSYSMPPQGTQSQSYGQPRANHLGDVPYQGLNSSTQSYGPGAPTQQSYPYGGSSMPMQQTYPPYGSAPAADGYNNPQPATASVPGYPQQSGQPVAGYAQLAQQTSGYGQVGPTGGYGTYPSSQTGYSEQTTANNANYGYQGAADPGYGSGPGSTYAAPTTGQPNYTQPAPTQQGYDQSIPPSGGYGPGGAPVGYGKSLSPQPGYAPYESNQIYGTHN